MAKQKTRYQLEADNRELLALCKLYLRLLGQTGNQVAALLKGYE